MIVYFISLFFQLLAGILPIIFFLIRAPKNSYELLVLLFCSVIATILTMYTSLCRINNHFIFNSYLLIEFSCICVFYSKAIKSKYSFLFLYAIVPFLIFSIFELYQNGTIIFGVKISSLFYIGFSVIYFLKYLFDSEQEHKYNFTYIINASFFIYNCSAFILIFYIMKLMTNNLWFIHNFIEGSSKLLIAYAFWKLPKTAHY